MNRPLISVFVLISFVSCSNVEDDMIANGEPVEIRLNAGVQASTTISRAAVTNGSIFTATVLGWETAAAVEDAPVNAPDWKTHTGSITASANGSAVTFTDPKYYQADGGKTFMKAVSPMLDVVENNIYSFKDAFPQDGSIDVLVSNVVSGTRSSTAAPLNFQHKLTQLTFFVKKGKTITDEASDELFVLAVTKAKLPTGFSLSTNDLILGDAFKLDVKRINPQESGKGIAIPSSREDVLAAQVGGPVMIAPINVADLSLEIITNNGTLNVNNWISSTGLSFKAGTSYTITLTFTNKEISGTASVAKWEEGTGSGTVE